MSGSFDSALQRLLSEDEATEAPVSPAPADIGAEHGSSVILPGDIHVSLYQFADWADANRAALAWNERDGEAGSVWRSATNGAVLLVGRAPDSEDDDYAARFALNDVIAGFAGKE